MNTLPLVIGVAATLDPGESGPVRDAVKAFFAELSRLSPHTPFRLLSCLGDKGDRRVAEIAESVGHGAKVEFDDRRPLSAAEAARHCHLLLAVWEGGENGSADGVAGLIRCKLEGAPNEGKAEWTPLDSPEVGPVYDVRPPRPPDAAALCAKRYPPPPDADAEPERSDPALRMREAERAYKAILGCVDTFNRDVAEVLPSLENVRLDSRDSLLLEDEERTKPPDEQRRLAEERERELPPAARTALGHFAATDALALYFQKRVHWVFRASFASALLAMIVFEVYAHSIHDFDPKYHPWGTGAYLALWALSLGLLWFFVRCVDYQNRRQDYRALAEALRVQFFWRVAGLPDAAEDHYLRKQRSELEWIRYALHTWNAFGSEGADAAGAVERIGFVARCWVRGQHQWFRKSARRERGRHLGWHWTSDALFILNLAGAAALFVVLLILLGRLSAGQASEPNPSGATGLSSTTAPPGEAEPSREEQLLRVEHWWVIGLGLAVVVAALCIGYTERLAHAQHGKQYQTMSILFGRASAALKGALAARPPDLAQAALILRELGKEALAENADWLLMHRERPLEAPRP